MPVSIVVPQLGESVAEGTVSKWLKAVGDRVRKEEPLVEIQTDKINVEIPRRPKARSRRSWSPRAPRSSSAPRSACSAPREGAGAAAPAAAAAPAPGGGARARAAAAPHPRPPPRAAPRHRRRPRPAPRAPSRRRAREAVPASGNGAEPVDDRRNLSPAVRKIMREQDVAAEELARIRGSGLAGRVTRDDLLEYLKTRGSGSRRGAAGACAPLPRARPRRGAAVPRRRAADPRPSGAREETIPFTQGAQADRREHGQRQTHRGAHALLRRGRHERDRRAQEGVGTEARGAGHQAHLHAVLHQGRGARAQGVPVGERVGGRRPATRSWSSTTTTSASRWDATRRG